VLTVKDLRNLLKELDDEQPVWVCLCGPGDAARFHQAAEAYQECASDVIDIRVPSPLRVIGGFQADEGGVLLVVATQED